MIFLEEFLEYALTEETNVRVFDRLKERISVGLLEYTNRITAAERKSQYNTMSEEQQYLVRLYLAWLFLYGTWMRFWKGPGHPWPRMTAREMDVAICEPSMRDEHVFIQDAIRTVLMNAYEKDPRVNEWITDLNSIQFNFRTRAGVDRGSKIGRVLEEVAKGEYCMGVAGDEIIQTSYYWIVHGLQLGSLDDFLAEMLPYLLEMEKQMVDYQLGNIRNPEINEEVRRRVEVLRERQRELEKPVPELPPFEPKEVRPNIHID